MWYCTALLQRIVQTRPWFRGKEHFWCKAWTFCVNCNWQNVFFYPFAKFGMHLKVWRIFYPNVWIFFHSVHSVLCNLTKVAPPKFTYFPFLPFHCETQKALIGRAFKQPTAFIKPNLSHFFFHSSKLLCLPNFFSFSFAENSATRGRASSGGRRFGSWGWRRTSAKLSRGTSSG